MTTKTKRKTSKELTPQQKSWATRRKLNPTKWGRPVKTATKAAKPRANRKPAAKAEPVAA